MMKLSMALFGSAAAVSTSTRGILDRVVKTLETMNGEIEQQRQESKEGNAKQNSEFEQQILEFENQIKDYTTKRNQGQAEFEKGTADAASAEEKINTAIAQIAQYKKELADATAVHGDEMSRLTQEIDDINTAMDTVSRAIKTVAAGLKKQEEEALIQTAQKYVPAKVKSLKNLLQQAPSQSEDYSVDNQARNQGVVDLLEGIRTTIKGELDDKTKERFQTNTEFQMLQQQLDGQFGSINTAKSEKAVQEQQKADGEKLAADGKAKANANQAGLDQATESKATTESIRETTNEQFKNLMKELADQEAAIGMAISMLANHAKAFLQKAGVSLVSISTKLQTKQVVNKLTSFLNAKAKSLDSTLLQQFSETLSGDAMDKVADLIRNMIQKLRADAQKEESHNGFCKREVAKLDRKMEANKLALDSATANIEALSADIYGHTKAMADLSAREAETSSNLKDATETREDNNKANKKAIEENKEARDAIEGALAILSKQFASSNTKASGSFSRVQALLEQASMDCGKMVEHFEMEESEQDDLYVDLKKSLNKDLKAIQTDLDFNTRQKNEKSADLQTEKATEQTQKETKISLDKQHEALTPQCMSTGVNYEERVARREAEIQSLKEAMQILQANDPGA